MAGLRRHGSLGTGSLAVLCALLVLAACHLYTSVDCGPLARAACDERTAEIRAVVAGEYPGRSITSIVIVNVEGHVKVTLDDGTELGFGERL